MQAKKKQSWHTKNSTCTVKYMKWANIGKTWYVWFLIKRIDQVDNYEPASDYYWFYPKLLYVLRNYYQYIFR